jgi:hypothetical protein
MDIKTKNKLRQKVIDLIRIHFTDIKVTNHETPYTRTQISAFVSTNTDKIDECVAGIYDDFEAQDKLGELVNPKDTDIYDYVFDFIHRIEYFS